MSTLDTVLNDLVIAKVARSKLGRQGEWYIEGERGLSIVVKPAKDGRPGVASYYVRYQIGKGARRKQVRTAIGRAGEGCASMIATTNPGNPAPDPRSTQALASGANATSWAQSAK